jgi:4-diphosphocytidyl-2-C-methyl-D-erythritol kinase
MFDRRLRGPVREVNALVEAVRSEDVAAIAHALGNNLGDVAAEIAPSVGDALVFLRQSPGVLGTLVAGSGSTVFGVCADASSAERAALEASGRDDWWAVATGASSSGVRTTSADRI